MDYEECLALLLPADSVQAIARGLPWADVLSMRQTCKHWRYSIARLIKTIRLPISPGCCSTATQPAHTAACSPTTADHARGAEQFGRAEQRRTPAKLLQAAVGSALQSVSCIELVLTESTTDTDLQEVIEVLAEQEHLQEVLIREIQPVHITTTSRVYAKSLNLARLRQISKLSIWSPVTWSLADILQQVAAMNSPSQPGPDGSGKQPQLHTLEIHEVAALTVRHMCPTLVAGFSPSLHHLLTPLPGNVSPQGVCCCPLNISHSSYLTSLAAAIPGLRSLRILGCCQAATNTFKAFQHLTELQVCLDLQTCWFNSLTGAEGEEDETPCPRLLLEQMPRTLQKLVLKEQELPRQEPSVPLRLGWLPELTPRLQHLTARLTATTQATRLNQAHPLLSLQVLHMQGSSEQLLQDIAAVGQQLTSLEINCGGVDLWSSEGARRFSFMNHRPSAVVDSALFLMTNITALSLLACNQYVAFSVLNPAAVWAALPSLSKLRLQGVQLGRYRCSRRPLNIVPVGFFDTGPVMIRGARSGSPVFPLVPLLLADLPQIRLQELELGRYMIEVDSDQVDNAVGDVQHTASALHQQLAPTQQLHSSGGDRDKPSNQNAPPGHPSTPPQAAAACATPASTCNTFAALRRLVLVNCQVNHAPGGSLQPLLELLSDQLTEIQLLRSSARPEDLALIGRRAQFQNLQHLQFIPVSNVHDSNLSWSAAVAALAAKAKTRSLKQLRRLHVDMSEVTQGQELDFELLPELLAVTQLLNLRVVFHLDLARQQQDWQQQERAWQQDQQLQMQPQEAQRCSARGGTNSVGQQAEDLRKLGNLHSTITLSAIGRVIMSRVSLSRLRHLDVTLTLAPGSGQSVPSSTSSLAAVSRPAACCCSLNDIRHIMMEQLPRQLPTCRVAYNEQQQYE